MSAKPSPSDLWDGSNEPTPDPLPAPAHSAYVDAPEPDPWTHLEPLFTVQAWTNEEKCGHTGPIPEGSSFVCMGCHQAGKDGTRALPLNVQRLPDDPRPAEPAEKPKNRKERRRERREAARSGRPAA